MKFVADENIDRSIVERLRSEGHELFYVAEMDPGISDDEVLGIADDNNALLLTADKDFGELVYRLQKIHSGVVLIRLSGLSISAKAAIISSAIASHGEDFPRSFTVVSHSSIRIRHER